MNIKEIECLAIKFRQAADEAFEYGAFGQEYPFNKFPYDCCDDMCDLFGEFLISQKINVSKVHGMYRYDYWEHKYPHVWLCLEDGTVIDLTGDQYKNNPIMLKFDIPCYVGRPNRLHQLFPRDEIKSYPFYGIDNYSDVKTKQRLWNLYDIILDFLKSK